jgi:hypothetical protein
MDFIFNVYDEKNAKETEEDKINFLEKQHFKHVYQSTNIS